MNAGPVLQINFLRRATHITVPYALTIVLFSRAPLCNTCFLKALMLGI